MMPYFEDVAGAIRKIVSQWAEVDPSKLADDFRWVDSVTVEDAGWLLGDISKHCAHLHLFPHKLDPDTLELIATVGKLISYVETKLASLGY